MLLAFAGIVLPLWGFAALVDGLREERALGFDIPLLRMMHSVANPTLDHVFLAISAVGYGGGVLPADALLVLWLACARYTREALFAGIAVLGSLALDAAIKHFFARARPSAWESLVHESSYSFPSGHAMASMTLALVVVLLCWSGRLRGAWRVRWPTTCVAAFFVLLVGLSRVYLGVHFPSDVLAGWAAATAWVVSVHACTTWAYQAPWRQSSTAS